MLICRIAMNSLLESGGRDTEQDAEFASPFSVPMNEVGIKRLFLLLGWAVVFTFAG